MMVKKDKNESLCGAISGRRGCGQVEALISIDERGQMVLPKEIRDKAKIRAGDKLAVISWERGGKINYICLVKAEDFAELIRSVFGPMMKEITQNNI